MNHCEDRCNRHSPFEAERNEDRNDNQEDHECPNRLVGDVTPPARTDHIDVDVVNR